MFAKKRRHEPSVVRQLFSAPQKFGFFQAVRVLELWLKRDGVPHDQVLSRVLRFRNTVSLGFPPSEIEAIETERRLPDSTGAVCNDPTNVELDQVALTTPFMGFLGASGTLPSHYSERIAAHQANEKDEGPRAFLDTFSGRAVAHFYEAWRKYRLEFKYELNGNDQFLPLLLSLAGLGHSSLHRRLHDTSDSDAGLCDESLGHLAAALRQRPMSAHYLQQLLREHFGVPISVEQFVGAWYAVPQEQQTALGSGNAVLGSIALLGERVWQRNLRICLRIGPLARAEYEKFLPYGPAARSLQKLVGMLSGNALEYDVELILRAEDVRGAQLGSIDAGGRLGWDSFVGAGGTGQDRCEVQYRLNAA